MPVFRYADRSKPIDGQCVVLEDGLLFVAAGAEDWAREIVLGSAPTLRSRTLDALPVQPIRAKLEQLRESPNTTWVAFAGVAPWGDSTNGWRLTQEHHVLTLSPTAVQRAELLAVRDRTRDDAVRRGP